MDHEKTYIGSFRIWRGDASGGALVDFDVEVNEGEVVLDVIHRIQATQAGDLAVRWNCKAGKCGSCSAEINGLPRLMCMTRMDTFDRDRDDHGHAAADVPGHPRPGHRRLVQLREGQAGPGVHAAAGPQARRVPHAAGRRRARPGVPQVHRVLHVPERLPRHPRPRGQQAGLRRPPALHPLRRARHAPVRHGRPPRRSRGGARPRASATSPSAAPRSAPSTSRSPTTRSSR